MNRRQRPGGMQLAEIGAIPDGLLRRRVVPDEAGEAFSIPGEPGLGVAVAQLLAAELIEIPVREERALADALAIDQAESTLERGGWRAGLLEEVGIRPVTHRLDGSLDAPQLFENVGSAEIGIMDRVARAVAGAPFREIDRNRGMARISHLTANIEHVVDDRAGVFRELVIGLPIGIQKAGFDAVGVGGDEIHG